MRAAAEVRAAYRELTHNVTTQASAETIATRPGLGRGFVASLDALAAASELAHGVAEAADRSDLAGPARALSRRAHDDIEAGLATADLNDDQAWVSPADILAKRLVSLPPPVVEGLMRVSAEVVRTPGRRQRLLNYNAKAELATSLTMSRPQTRGYPAAPGPAPTTVRQRQEVTRSRAPDRPWSRPRVGTFAEHHWGSRRGPSTPDPGRVQCTRQPQRPGEQWTDQPTSAQLTGMVDLTKRPDAKGKLRTPGTAARPGPGPVRTGLRRLAELPRRRGSPTA